MGLLASVAYMTSVKIHSLWKAVTILCLLIIFLVVIMMVATRSRTLSLLNSPPHSQVEPRKFAQFLLIRGKEWLWSKGAGLYLLARVVRTPDPSGRKRKGLGNKLTRKCLAGMPWFGSQTLLVEGRGKGLVNYLQLARIHGCIPAISVDEGKNST